MTYFTDLVLGVLAGPLAAAGIAKLWTPSRRLRWPIRHPLLRLPHGPKLIGAAELAVVVMTVVSSAYLAALAVAITYALLAAGAYLIRGRRCACFGAARLAAVGRTHISLNVLAASAALIVLLAGDDAGRPNVPLRVVFTVGVALVLSGLIQIMDRRDSTRIADGKPCGERIYAVRMYVSDDCPACRALKDLIAKMSHVRHSTIETITVGMRDELPKEVQGLGVPCAVGLGPDGSAICAPAEGIGAVKRLIESVTIAPETTVDER